MHDFFTRQYSVVNECCASSKSIGRGMSHIWVFSSVSHCLKTTTAAEKMMCDGYDFHVNSRSYLQQIMQNFHY